MYYILTYIHSKINIFFHTLFFPFSSTNLLIFLISFLFFFSFVSFSLQLTEQIQNLTVSSTTSTTGAQQLLPSSSTKGSSHNIEKNLTSATIASALSTNNSNNNITNNNTSINSNISNSSSLKNILKETAATSNTNSVKECLAQRLKFLQNKLAHAPMPSITSKRRQLPSIEEAWNLPISAEMSSRQQQTAQSNQQRAYAKNYNHVSVSILWYNFIAIVIFIHANY